jgi:hypothetical protein
MKNIIFSEKKNNNDTSHIIQHDQKIYYPMEWSPPRETNSKKQQEAVIHSERTEDNIKVVDPLNKLIYNSDINEFNTEQ